MVKKYSILVVNKWIPKPDCHSGDFRLFQLLKILESHCRCDLWVPPESIIKQENKRYIDDLRAINIRVLDQYKDPVNAIMHHSYDFIIIEFYKNAVLYLDVIKRLAPGIRTIIESIDIHFVREELDVKYNRISQEEYEKHKALELLYYSRSDAITVVSEPDREALIANSIDPDRIFLIPNIIPGQKVPAFRSSSKELVFVGGFNWYPNADGIIWFVKKVWPMVIQGVKDARLTIIGSNPTKEIVDLGVVEGVTVAGYVPDTAPFLRNAAVSIAPLRTGGGMKGKINEAMAFGLPVVTTSVGAQGFSAVSGIHMMIEDEPDKFANAIMTLLRDEELRRTIGRNGHVLNAGICSPGIVEGRVMEMLAKLETLERRILPGYIIIKFIYYSYYLLINKQFVRYLIESLHSENKWEKFKALVRRKIAH
jgi:O-antigen biosynthesis protein